MLTIYATGILWTQWPDMQEQPITILLPLPVGEVDIDLPASELDV